MSTDKNVFLHTDLSFLKGVGPHRADTLKTELGLHSYADMVFHFPYRYTDRSQITLLKDIVTDEQYLLCRGRLLRADILGEKSTKRLVATIADESSEVELVWFKNFSYVQKNLKVGAPYFVFGRPTLFRNGFNFPHPELVPYNADTVKEFSEKPFMPMYHTTDKMKLSGMDSRFIAQCINAIISHEAFVPNEFIPTHILESEVLIGIKQALIQIHHPSNNDSIFKARQRLIFQEFFIQQLKVLRLRNGKALKFKGQVFEKVGDNFNTFYNEKLPFTLTNAQKRVLKEIRQNTLTGLQMNRLIQGDVGSGKTVVAALSMLIAMDNGFQAAMMAPTEILANQHYVTLCELLKDMPVNIQLLTGSTTAKTRRGMFEDLANGKINILIGTHALIEDPVIFHNLGLVVIDEQHRFGVEQRSKLWRKNNIAPHVLVMTATPIPRTLAMTIYGDLDVSIIDELPPGRKPIVTVWRNQSQRDSLYQFIRDEVAKGRQIYIVYPLIKESEKLDLQYLELGFEELQKVFPTPQYTICMVHGKLKAKDKEAEMQRFVRGEAQIMVATTVIEVGVNVANASVMLIENAERFGLSQLHQLRGRIGRGAESSYCILLTSNKVGDDSRRRMKTMVATQNGFEISEIDMQMRGPGDIFGKRQSGVVDLKIADLVKDQAQLIAARDAVAALLDADSTLSQYPALLPLIENRESKFWEKIS